MRYRVICIAVLIMLLSCGIAFANQIRVTGYGITAQEAENDALRQAVEQAVGLLVDSQTLVQNNTVLRDQIFTQSRGFITNYVVLDRVQTMNGWSVSIDANVDDNPNSKLMTELTRLGIINVQLRNPQIVVYIPEHHIQYRIPDPAGETAVVNALLASGFSNVKVGQQIEQSYNWNSKSYRGMTVDDMRAAASHFSADILIVGEAFSEGVGDMGNYLPGTQRTGMQSCRARMEAKMYISQTGQIIAADGKYGAGTDISQSIASKKALAAAGQQMGEYLAEQLLNLGASARQNLEITAVVTDFSKITMLQEALGRVPGVKNIQLTGYEGGIGKITVQYSGAPQTLFQDLQTNCATALTRQELAYNKMTI